MTTAAPDALDLAVTAVDEDAFTRAPDGSLIAQTSSRAIITTMIRQLHVEPGDTILEIGTGSAYSTALLAQLAGPDGTVTSLDVMPELTERANLTLAAHGYTQANAITGDGALGAPRHAPYNKIIAWTTPEAIPSAWVAQAAHGATLVSPVNLTGLSKTYGVITATVEDGALVTHGSIIRGSFVEMGPQARADWLLPPHGIDALFTAPDNAPCWLSSLWLRQHTNTETGNQLARELAEHAKTAPSVLAGDEDAVGFYAWLLATRPEGMTTACLGTPQWLIGHTAEGSAALLPLAGHGSTTVIGSSTSSDALTSWAGRWRTAGAPAWNELISSTTRTPGGEWLVRARFGRAAA